MAPIVEVELKSGVYPASTEEMRVARCYVCNEIADKVRMVSVGTAVNPGAAEGESRLLIYRCKDCTAGSEKWLKHFMNRSPLRALYMGLEGKKMDAELMKSVGRQIVEKTREKHEKAICDRMDAKRGVAVDVKTANPAVFATVTGRVGVPKKELQPSGGGTTSAQVEGGVSVKRKKRSWRTVTVRRGR